MSISSTDWPQGHFYHLGKQQKCHDYVVGVKVTIQNVKLSHHQFFPEPTTDNPKPNLTPNPQPTNPPTHQPTSPHPTPIAYCIHLWMVLWYTRIFKSQSNKQYSQRYDLPDVFRLIE